MKKIPRTTLVCVDCHFPKLALRALSLTLAQCEYEAVRFFTDADPGPIGDTRIEVVPVARIANAADHARFMLKDLARHVASDFVQVIQWDGYVVHGDSWSDDFLDYDYIGARWVSRPAGNDVGNGGFSLRSRRLLEALADSEIEAAGPEDNTIGLRYRALLESRHGIRFAPGAVADRYAFEGGIPSGRELGFARLYNFPYFYDDAALAEVVAALPDEALCHPVSITLVEKLASLGRKAEALRYAQRLRTMPPYAALPTSFKTDLRHAVFNLAARHEPCPCGSGLAFRRCCGSASIW